MADDTCAKVMLASGQRTFCGFGGREYSMRLDITTDPPIAFPFSIVALPGLRPLNREIPRLRGKFGSLKTGLSFMLVFVGAKMLRAGAPTLPPLPSLAVVSGLLGRSVVSSRLHSRSEPLPPANSPWSGAQAQVEP